MVQTWNLFILLRASHDQCKKGTILWAKLKKNAYVDRPKGFPRISGILTIQYFPFLFEREIWHFNFNLTMFAYVCRCLSFSTVNSSTYLILKILSDIIIFFFHLNYVSRYQFSSILFPWAFHMISSYSQGSNGLLFSLRHYFDITCVRDIYRRVISGFLSFARAPERFNHWLSLARSHLIIW